MLQVESITREYPVISSGPDWITATAKRGSKFVSMCDLGHEVLWQRKDAGRATSSASRMGFQGWSCDGFFYGVRDDLAICIASGPNTPTLVKPIIEVADNVSRLDLQVTVFAGAEQPNLAIEGYRRLTRQRTEAHRPGMVTLITSDPKGQTLNVNKRTSDSFGRLYDKASESDLGPPRSIWRAETEFKRSYAMDHALALRSAASISSHTRTQVHRWWSRKGVDMPFAPDWSQLDVELSIKDKNRDVLSWFERSVSITVARAVKLHGLSVTVAALGLSALVAPIRKEDD